MKFINVGFNNMIAAARVVAVIGPDSAPAKRLVQDARDSGRAIDCTSGRRTRGILITDSDHIVLSSIQPETIAARLTGEEEEEDHRA